MGEPEPTPLKAGCTRAELVREARASPEFVFAV
jgi:hypothetical protein